MAIPLIDRFVTCLEAIQAMGHPFFKRLSRPVSGTIIPRTSKTSQQVDSTAHKNPDCIYVGYVGGLDWAQDMGIVLDAAKILKARGLGSKFRFLILGEGEQKKDLIRKAKEDRLSQIDFIPLSDGNLNFYRPIFDLYLIHYKNMAVFEETLSERIMECKNKGIPVLLGMKGVSARFIEKEKIGVTFEPDAPEDLASALERIYSDKPAFEELRQRCRKKAQR